MTLDSRARVLIADADPVLRRDLSKRLLDADVFADCVADGKMALEAFGVSNYAVVILDLALQPVTSERVLDFIAAPPARAGRSRNCHQSCRSSVRSSDYDNRPTVATSSLASNGFRTTANTSFAIPRSTGSGIAVRRMTRRKSSGFCVLR